MALVNSIIELLLTIDIIAVPIGIITSIVFAIQARGIQDPIAKKSKKTWAWRALLWPLGILILLVVVYGLAILIANTFQPQ